MGSWRLPSVKVGEEQIRRAAGPGAIIARRVSRVTSKHRIPTAFLIDDSVLPASRSLTYAGNEFP